MKKLLEWAGLGLLVIGGCSVLHHYVSWFDKWALVEYLPLADEHKLYVGGAVIVLGLVVLLVSDKVSDEPRPATGGVRRPAVPEPLVPEPVVREPAFEADAPDWP
ncbi:hypothetical protein ACMA1D_06955 [Streptomyces sp. 796.1]|uniref:hypothetical protein n=1 Tax=Streptomyces sp. 796.1 TaxID=3163029 RepID=UPI0039C953C7